MTLKEIRKFFNVPAKRGMRIVYFRPDGWEFAEIIGSDYHAIKIVTESGIRRTVHPIHCIKYLDHKVSFRWRRTFPARKINRETKEIPKTKHHERYCKRYVDRKDIKGKTWREIRRKDQTGETPPES